MSTDSVNLFNDIRTKLEDRLQVGIDSRVIQRGENWGKILLITPLVTVGQDEKQYILTINGESATLSRCSMIGKPYPNDSNNVVQAEVDAIVELIVTIANTFSKKVL